MKIDRFVHFLAVSLTTCIVLLVGATSSWAQKQPPPAGAQGPTINPLMPSGVQRGHVLELTVTGASLTNPTGVSLGRPAKVIIPTEDKNGQDAGKFKVHIDVPADTPIGWYPMRVATLKGHDGAIFAIAYHPGTNWIVTGGHEGKLRVFETAKGEPVGAFFPAPLSAARPQQQAAK